MTLNDWCVHFLQVSQLCKGGNQQDKKSIIPLHRIWLLLASPSSKTSLLLNKSCFFVGTLHGGCAPPMSYWIRGLANTHPKILLLFGWGCKHGLSKAPAAFLSGILFELLTPNISVSHSFIHNECKQCFEVWRNVHLWNQALQNLLSVIENSVRIIFLLICSCACCAVVTYNCVSSHTSSYTPTPINHFCLFKILWNRN